MNRWILGSSAALAVVLTVSAVAIAKPAVPASGPYSGLTSQKLVLSASVSKAGASRKIELKTFTIQLTCSLNGTPIPIPETFTSKYFKEGEKGKPLAVKSGKFAYNGPLFIGGSPPPTINLSGKFQSPEKATGTISISPFTTEPVAGQKTPCEASKVSFNIKHG